MNRFVRPALVALALILASAGFSPAAFAATITSTADGNWNAGGTWVGGVAPGDGDSAIIKHNVTITADQTVGTQPATGGTAAISFTNTANKTLTLNSGITLTVKGDISFSNASSTILSTFQMNSGSHLRFFPASGAAYGFIGAASSMGNVDVSGTSGSHCTILTDTSLGGTSNGWTFASNRQQGFRTVTYLDLTDFGSSTKAGLAAQWQGVTGAGTTISWTNCTLLRSNSSVSVGTGLDITFTMTSVIQTSSVGTNAFFCSFPNSGTNLHVISLCSFDKQIQASAGFTNGKLIDCYVGGNFSLVGAFTGWADETYIQGNLFYPGQQGTSGGMSDCYFANTTTTNPHFIVSSGVGTNQANWKFKNLIFEAVGASNDGTGDCILTGGSTSTAVTGCIVLPTTGNKTSGVLFTILGSPVAQTWSFEHNTFYAGSQAGSAVGESGAGTPGEVSSLRGNLCWENPQVTNGFLLWDSGHLLTGGTADLVSPTNADYNATWNIQQTPAAGNTYTHAKNGYQANFSADPGTHDLADQNPQFVDSTRNLASWGTTQGGDGTNAGALAIIAANPSLIRQANTGLLAWVRGGFVPRNANLKNASYPGDTSTVDAAGTAWPGGGPGLGAMAVGSSSGLLMRRRRAEIDRPTFPRRGEFFFSPKRFLAP